MQRTSVLTFNTFVAPPVPVVTNDLPPGQTVRAWSPITATLISGERDAVLVDPLMTIKQGRALADWVACSGRNLTTVYITHGRALDIIEALHPRAVVAGHERAGRADDPAVIDETRGYIRAFDRIAENTSTAGQLYERMLSLYPDRVNPGALWSSARAEKGSSIRSAGT